MDEPVAVERQKQAHQKPPRSLGRIAGEVLAGAATGAAGAALAYSPLYVVAYVAGTAGWGEGCMGSPIGWMIMGIMLLVVPQAYGLASAVGVYLVGSRAGQTGSFLATLGFGLIGGVVMVVMFFPVLLVSAALVVGVENIVRWALWVLVSLIPPISATLGFNLTHRYKKPPSS